MTQDNSDALGAIIREWERLVCANDFPGLKALWDESEPEPIYVAEEGVRPFVGWPAIERYWAGTSAAISRITARTWNHQFRDIAPGVALALYEMHWNAQVGTAVPIAGDVRVSALFRQTLAGWRFFHYIEAPLAMLTQVRHAAQRNVDSAFMNG